MPVQNVLTAVGTGRKAAHLKLDCVLFFGITDEMYLVKYSNLRINHELCILSEELGASSCLLAGEGNCC